MAQTQALSTQPSGSLDPADQRRDEQQAGALIRSVAAQRGSLRKTEFYSPQKDVQAPTARAIQKMANAQHISSEVLRLEWKNEDNFKTAMCTAYVRAWIGSRSRPKQEQVEALTMSMSAIAQKYILKKLTEKWKGSGPAPSWFTEKQISEKDITLDEPTGRMWPTTRRLQMEMLSFMADQFAFLDRLAITKAQARAFDKLLRPDAQVHYGDEEGYDGDHEKPSSNGSDENEGADTDHPAESEETAGPARADPPAAPSETPHQERAQVMPQDTSFPPTEEELAAHEETLSKASQEAQNAGRKAVEELKMGERAQTLLASIEEKKASKKLLDGMADDLKNMKSELPPEEYAQVMQTFWTAYREAQA